MKATIVGWGKITPKKTGKECYLLCTEIPAESGFNGVRTREIFCSLDTAVGLERVKLPISANFEKNLFTGKLEVTLNA